MGSVSTLLETSSQREQHTVLRFSGLEMLTKNMAESAPRLSGGF
jgi:hypothetical protein